MFFFADYSFVVVLLLSNDLADVVVGVEMDDEVCSDCWGVAF